ncbi:hypothetical protein KC19_8G103500 [Ceratodon purpureus]|uniref:YchJ-like middle NTF2-like domain-containing protein n=1 Tax=Ceratodon purpureus TaxID=3225 RepID=A0A8T0GX57_CERPU|nr:hypothetical protein KC19_8G103500 [Ceratodon purpureus]
MAMANGVTTAALCTSFAPSASTHSPRCTSLSTQCSSLSRITRSWELRGADVLRFNPATEFGSPRLQTGRGPGGVRAAKGFGELLQKKKKGGAEVNAPKEPLTCPCGGGEERREFADCCARYHGGVVEPDALTLMKARFSAYARSKVDYVVRTTHPENPDFGGEKELADDVRATCERLRFTRLEILDDETPSEDEAFVSFRVTYALIKGGRGGDKQHLVEKSRFVKEGDRWLYRERIPISQASEAAWMASTTPNYVSPDVARKSFTKGKAQPGISPRKG